MYLTSCSMHSAGFQYSLLACLQSCNQSAFVTHLIYILQNASPAFCFVIACHLAWPADIMNISMHSACFQYALLMFSRVVRVVPYGPPAPRLLNAVILVPRSLTMQGHVILLRVMLSCRANRIGWRPCWLAGWYGWFHMVPPAPDS